MLLNAQQLEQHLTHYQAENFPSIILLNGNEPLLVEEALTQLRQFAKQAGFVERLGFQVTAGFDWQSLIESAQTRSLFSERKLFEVRVPKSLGKPGIKAVEEFIQLASNEDCLLLIMPALDKRQKDSAWVNKINQHGWVIDCPSVPLEQFPWWLKQRLQSRALRVEAGVVELLSEQLEGNLLAAAQEIDKLVVLAEEGAVTLQLLQQCLADQARFDVYALSDMCLAGDWVKARRILKRLQSEGVEAVIVVWALVREVRMMVSVSQAIAQGQSKAAVFRSFRIWRKKEPLVSAALMRLDAEQWLGLLQRVGLADRLVKGQISSDQVGGIWFELELVCAQMCGKSFLPVISN